MNRPANTVLLVAELETFEAIDEMFELILSTTNAL
jgi:hypothetical protein